MFIQDLGDIHKPMNFTLFQDIIWGQKRGYDGKKQGDNEMF